MDTPAIQVDAIQKTYRSGWFGRHSVKALRSVSFQVEPGCIFGLLGPNGAGKTTLIKVLLGLVRKTAGNASLLGFPAGDRRGRLNVGYLPENHRIPRHLTGNSAMIYYGGLSGMAPSEVRARRPELLDRVGLARWGKMPVRKYSKGMLQRLGLAQALLHDPQLLMLDEPTDGVDPVGRTEMRAVLQELKAEGKTVFINSHLLQEIELVCDRVAILDKGLLRRVGAVAELTDLQKPNVIFTVVGPEHQTLEAFVGANIISHERFANGQIHVVLRSPDQETVNQCIDRLRTQSIDIVSVNRLKITLEQAFLQIVQNHDEPATAEIVQKPSQ
jgi:ABC-2 type transport system ATP-binding protein